MLQDQEMQGIEKFSLRKKIGQDDIARTSRVSSETDRRSRETKLSQFSSITGDRTTIVAFEGLKDEANFAHLENGGEKIGPDLKMIVMRDNQKSDKYEAMLKETNFASIFTNIQAFIEKNPDIKEKFPNLDLENLTPYEACSIAGDFVRARIQYDVTGISRNFGENVEKTIDFINRSFEPAERERILKMFNENTDKYNDEWSKWSYERRSWLDSLSADQILKNGFGVCWHIAFCYSASFYALKQFQKGSLLNDAHVAMYAPGYYTKGKNKAYEIDIDHAYNMIINYVPGTSAQKEQPDILMTVVDPTWAEESEDLDYTYRRLTSCLNFLSLEGKNLGIRDSKKEVDLLVDKILEKINPDNLNWHFYLEEWISLLEIKLQNDGCQNVEKQVMKQVEEINLKKGQSRAEFFMTSLYLKTLMTEKYRKTFFKAISEFIRDHDEEAEEIKDTIFDRFRQQGAFQAVYVNPYYFHLVLEIILRDKKFLNNELKEYIGRCIENYELHFKEASTPSPLFRSSKVI